MFICEPLDHVRADPAVIDYVLTWRRGLEPEVVATLASDFLLLPVDMVAA